MMAWCSLTGKLSSLSAYRHRRLESTYSEFGGSLFQEKEVEIDGSVHR